MPRDPNIPEGFDVLTLVILRRPPDAPQMSDEERCPTTDPALTPEAA